MNATDLGKGALYLAEYRLRTEEERKMRRKRRLWSFSPGVRFTFIAAKWELSRQILSRLNFSISMALVL